MARRFLVVTVCLVGTIAFLVGLIVAGSMTPAPALSAPQPTRASIRATPMPSTPLVGSFADIAERLNPAVVTPRDVGSRGPGSVRPATGA
jgi:hypothetical protein